MNKLQDFYHLSHCLHELQLAEQREGGNRSHGLLPVSYTHLLSILNSQAILWYSYVTNMNKTGVGDVQVGGQNIITFPIPAYSDNKNILAKMADCVTNQKISLKSVDYQIENTISEIFGFTTDEKNFLNTFANSLRKKG